MLHFNCYVSMLHLIIMVIKSSNYKKIVVLILTPIIFFGQIENFTFFIIKDAQNLHKL